MEPAVRDAVGEWCSGALIGVIPLITHFGTVIFVDASVSATDWSKDMLFIVMSNSGLSALSAFRNLPDSSSRKTRHKILMALTILCVALAALVYGQTPPTHYNIIEMIKIGVLLVVSLLISLLFEMSLARRAITPAPPATPGRQ